MNGQWTAQVGKVRLGARGAALLAVTALALTACLPQGVQLPQNPVVSALVRKSGRIVYLGVDGNVYTMDQTGGNLNQITTDAVLTGEATQRYYDYPAWSPDGEKIAFVELEVSASGQSATLQTADREGKEVIEAFAEPNQTPFYLYWSPDGEQISFLSASSGSSDLRLQLVPAAGGDVQTLDAGQPYYWHWSPDGTQILVHVGGAAVEAGARLAVLGVTGGVSEMGLPVQPTIFQSPAWSPDGRQTLLAVTQDEKQGALVLADANGVEQSQLATLEGGVAFGWSPDGKHIAYITGDAQNLGTLGKLTLMDPAKPEGAVTLDNESVVAFFWAPNSEELAYFVPEIIEATPEPNSGTAEAQRFLILHLFIVGAKGGESRDIATFVPTRDFYNILPYFDQYQHSTTIWSPDSKNIVLSAYGTGDGVPGIFVVHSSGNLEPRFLKEGTLGLWSPK